MSTSAAIDGSLLKEAKKLGKHKTEKAAINDALKMYVKRKRQAEIIELFGTVDFDPEFLREMDRKKK